MTIKHQHLAIAPVKKIALAIVVGWTLSACSTTANDSGSLTISTNQKSGQITSVAKEMSMEELVQCQQNANDIEQHAESQASSAQYLNAGKTLKHCLKDLSPTDNQEQQVVMKMIASATLNFIKAGDVNSANEMVERFKKQNPDHDLYFSDYTSFLDTATALLTPDSLSAGQLSSLNISRALRYEIERKHYWLSH